MPKKSTGKVIETGKFISGTKWKKYERIKHKGKTYNTKKEYYWIDQDFPHIDQEQEAIQKAIKAGEERPHDADVYFEYLDDSKKYFRFRCKGFLKYDGSVDCLPNAPLGRIPVKDLHTEPYEG